ncbi:MAG: archaeal proteasome endopeptidase complex subunit beta [Candidatus Hadarchaeaceae archaeon]
MKEEKPEHLKGTTTVGMVCKDGVVLATDSRATMGYLVASKKSKKIYSITERIAFTTAGGVADTDQLVNMMRAEAGYYAMHNGTPMSVSACAKMVSNLMNSYIYYANLLVGGMDDDAPRLFFIDIDGGMIEEKMLATGSGSPVAYGVLETDFREDMKTDDAIPIAIRAIKTAMKRDVATGNEVLVAVITKKGYRELTPEEIKKLA